MSRLLSCAVLFAGFALLVASAGSDLQGQDKKDPDKKEPDKKVTDKKDKKKKSKLVLEEADKTDPGWSIHLAKLGLPLVADRNYAITALPKELVGSTYLIRLSTDYGKWLGPKSVKMTQDGTVYAMVRTQYNGTDSFNDTSQEQFEKDGWTPVKGLAATTFPGTENWRWKIWKKDIKAGDVDMPLEKLKWPGTAVLYFFK